MKNVLFTLCILLSFGAFAQQSTDNGPRVVFGELQHEGPYDRSEILLQDRLTISSGDGKAYEISSYHLTISPAKGKPIRFEEQGNKLSPKAQGALNQIVAGDRVLVESVFATVNGDQFDVVKLKPVILEIREFQSEGPYDSKFTKSNEPAKMDSIAHATFGSIDTDGGPHALEEILKQMEILVKSEGNVEYTVKSFKLIAVPKEVPPSMASSSNGQLTGQMQNMIGKLKSGDRILIEGIRAQADVNGKTIPANLSPIIITVL